MPEETLEETEWDFLNTAKDNMRVAIERHRDFKNPLDVGKFILGAREFISPAVTAWELLLKAYYIRNKLLLMNGKGKFHQLIRLLRDKNCSLDKKDKAELMDLIDVRNDITHKGMNEKRKELIAKKIKACIAKFDYYVDRFNCYIGDQFGPEYKLGESVVSKEIITPRLKQQGDLSENKPRLDTSTSSSIMNVEDSSQASRKIFVSIPNAEKEESIPSPSISVVVPVYRVEKYLRACVESVLAQTFTDFELILVDDGSPDKSGELCDELAKLDSRIRVFHQENGGVTSARKLGVEKARGEWINFVDSDDLLPPDALESLVAEATDDTDWVQGQFVMFKDGEKPQVQPAKKTVKTFDQIGLAENMLLVHAGLCRKIVRKKLFSPRVLDIPRDIRIREDMLASLRLVANKPRNPKEISSVVYLYRSQENSVLHSYLQTETYVFRCAKFTFAEARKIPTKSKNDRGRISYALSRSLCSNVACGLIGYGLPIKFPHRLATLIRRGAKSKPSYFATYLCLRFNYLATARLLANIFSFLRRKKLDPKTKTLLE